MLIKIRYLRYRVSVHGTGGDSVHGYSSYQATSGQTDNCYTAAVWEYYYGHYTLQSALHGLSVNISHGW